jgi:hypothetical protein
MLEGEEENVQQARVMGRVVSIREGYCTAAGYDGCLYSRIAQEDSIYYREHAMRKLAGKRDARNAGMLVAVDFDVEYTLH